MSGEADDVGVLERVRAILAEAVGDWVHCRFTFESPSETDPATYYDAAVKLREIADALDRCGDLVDEEFR